MSKPNKVPEKELGKCPPETEVLLQCLLDLAPVINTAKLLKKMNRNLKIRGDELIQISEGVQLNGIWVKEAISQIKEPDKSNAGLQKCSVPTQENRQQETRTSSMRSGTTMSCPRPFTPWSIGSQYTPSTWRLRTPQFISSAY